MSANDHPSGIYAAVATPFGDDDQVLLNRSVEHCQWLLRNGCDGLGILGTTGEANSMSLDERKRLIDAVVGAGIDPARLMPGTGACAIADTVDLTRQCLAAGITTVLMLPPFYYKDNSDDGLIAAFSRIIDRVNDPRLRILLYHFPRMSGVPISQRVARALVDAYPGIVVGMKDSAGDLDAMTAMMDAVPELAMFPGSEKLLGPRLNRIAGCITACANVGAPLIRKVWDQRGAATVDPDDIDRMLTMNRVVREHGLFPPLKALIARNTGEPQWENLRPPLMPIDPETRAALFAAFDATGYQMPPAG